MVNLTIAAIPGSCADDSALVLPLDHFYGLGECRTVALGDGQTATVLAIGNGDSLDLSEQLTEVKFARQRLGSGAQGKSEQQNFRQRFHHDGPEFGFNDYL